MTEISLIKHTKGCLGLRFLGLGPKFLPTRGISQLKKLLNNQAFWAKNRKNSELKKMLANSASVVTLWRGKRLVGFGRATSDKIFRAVLWVAKI